MIHKLVSINSIKFHYHEKSFHQRALEPLPCNPLSRFFSCIIFRRFSPRMVFFTSNSWPQGILHRIYRIHSDPPETKSGQAESTQGSPAPGSRMTVVCHKLPQIRMIILVTRLMEMLGRHFSIFREFHFLPDLRPG